MNAFDSGLSECNDEDYMEKDLGLAFVLVFRLENVLWILNHWQWIER